MCFEKDTYVIQMSLMTVNFGLTKLFCSLLVPFSKLTGCLCQNPKHSVSLNLNIHRNVSLVSDYG